MASTVSAVSNSASSSLSVSRRLCVNAIFMTTLVESSSDGKRTLLNQTATAIVNGGISTEEDAAATPQSFGDFFAQLLRSSLGRTQKASTPSSKASFTVS